MHYCMDKIRGSPFEEEIFPKIQAAKDLQELAGYRLEEKVRQDSICKTLGFLDSGKVPSDDLWATRMRIGEVRDGLMDFLPEVRMAQLRLLQSLHEQVFQIEKERRNGIQKSEE